MSPTQRAPDPGGVSSRSDAVGVGEDVLRLEGMRFFGHHGCLADERGAGVHLDVDVEVRTDTREAARSDRVEDTIDYARLVERCRRVVEDDSYHLVETVAERLAEELLEEPGASSVRVRVAKRPPLAVAVDRFSVTVERRRT
ncbi:MAG: dihydroneopterin aldolase [Candidatus Dormibacteria bacterium]